MRVIHLASFLLLSGGLSIACTDSGSGDGEGGASGVGASNGSGGTTNGTGGAGTGGGGGGAPPASGCGMTTKATGSDGLIDDFTDSENREPPFALPEDVDGRAGQWTHGHFLNPTFAQPVMGSDGMGGSANDFMSIVCEKDGGEGHEQCNTGFEEATPWRQYSAVDTLLQLWGETLNCYDVDGVYDTIEFDVRSGDADVQKFWMQIVTPDADQDKGHVYRSPEQSAPGASTDWKHIAIPLSAFAPPSFAAGEGFKGPSSPDLKALQSIAFVSRNVEAVTDPKEGEFQLPYNIEIDNVEFTKSN